MYIVRKKSYFAKKLFRKKSYFAKSAKNHRDAQRFIFSAKLCVTAHLKLCKQFIYKDS